MVKKQYFAVFLSAVLAGIMIGIGGTVYLSLEEVGQKTVGALLFAVGLFTIIIFKLHLYTGKVGYLPLPGADIKTKTATITLTVLGNVVGTMVFGLTFADRMILGTNISNMVDGKLALSLWDAFLLAIPCGILMFVAVEGYKRATSDVAKGIIVLFSVAVFILSGFEHSVADMFYFAAAKEFSLNVLNFILVVILGNAVGGAGFSGLTHYIQNNLKED